MKRFSMSTSKQMKHEFYSLHMGQLLAAIEPLSIDSLLPLRQHTPVDDPEDSDLVLVLEILHDLGSLLSNVTSLDQMRPIVPLHTSFRDTRQAMCFMSAFAMVTINWCIPALV
jgi:hypothetical protein